MPRYDLTFRVFVSSTFGDFIEERNTLQDEVFPRIREYCRRQGARFQAIDLRWGVPRDVANDQQTLDLCLQELRACQQRSPGANLIVLVGQRYGWRPLPSRIEASELDRLLAIVPSRQARRLRKWYRRDDNAVPAEYLLRPQGGFVKRDRWARLEEGIRKALSEASRRAFPADVSRCAKYHDSATHAEIRRGILESSEGTNALCYVRTIRGLPIDQTAEAYRDMHVDMSGEWVVDAEANSRIDALRTELESLSSDCLRAYEGEWKNGAPIIDMKAFAGRVGADLTRRIDAELRSFQSESPVVRERRVQLDFARARGADLCGRAGVLDSISRYLSSDNTQPLIITGPSGAGKTAVLAKIWLDLGVANTDVLCLCRIIGATPGSSELRPLIRSLCVELETPANASLELPDDFLELVAELEKRLQDAAHATRVVLILDGLDQIAPTDDAHSLHWLPQGGAARVKLLLSLRSDADDQHACLLSARRLFPKAFLELPELVPRDGEEMLAIWLGAAERDRDGASAAPVSATAVKRVLQPEQKAALLQGFAKCPIPLYLKLAFEGAWSWRSYDVIGAIAPDIGGILNDLFRRLERPEFHGPLLPGRALGYLEAARRGLSEDELIDILSTDLAVMDDFRRRSPDSPDVSTLPVVMWLRLASELGPYLVSFSFERAEVISFQHQQMAEAVSDNYLAGVARQESHEALAHYFARHSFLSETVEGQTVKQRIAGVDLRQVDELPWQLTEASSSGSDSAFAHLSSVLTDLTFVEAKCLAGHLHDLIADFSRAIRVAERLNPQDHDQRTTNLLGYARELSAFATRRRTGDADVQLPEIPIQTTVLENRGFSSAQRLQGYAKFLNQYSHLLGQYPHEAIPIARSSGGEQSLVQAADALCRERKAVWIAKSPLDLNCGRGITRVLTGSSPSVAVDAAGRLAVTARGRDKTAAVWDLSTGELLRYLSGHGDEVTRVALTSDGQTAVTGGGTRRHSTRPGIVNGAIMSTALVGVDGIPRSLVPDYSVRIWDTATGACRGEMIGHLDSIVGLAISADGEVVVSLGVDGVVRLWNVKTLQCTFANYVHLPNPRSLSLDATGDLVVIVCERGQLHIWHPKPHEWTVTAAPAGEKILAADVTPDGGLIVAITDRSLIAQSFAPELRKVVAIPAQPVFSEMPMPEILNRALFVQGAFRLARSDHAFKVHRDDSLAEWFERFSMNAVAILDEAPATEPQDQQKGVFLKVDPGIFGSSFGSTQPAIQVSDDGQTVVAIDGRKLLTWRPGGASQFAAATSWRRKLDAVSIAADGRVALVGGSSEAEFLDLTNLEEQAAGDESKGTMEILASAANGSQLITRRSSDGQRRLLIVRPSLNAATATLPVVVEGDNAQTRRGEFCASGNLVAVASSLDAVDVLETETGRVCSRLDNEGSIVTRLVSAPDSDLLLTSDDRQRIRVWNARTGQLRSEMIDHTAGIVRCLTVSGDGSTAASGGDDRPPSGENDQGPVLRVWNIRSGHIVRRLRGHRATIDDIVLDQRGTSAVSVSAQHPGGALRFWDLEFGLSLRAEPVEPLNLYSGDVLRTRNLRYAPDGATVALGAFNNDMGGVRLFHSIAGPLDDFSPAKPKFHRLDFVRSGRVLIGHSWGGTRLCVWDVVTGDLLAEYPEPSSIWPLDFQWVDSPTGMCVLPVGDNVCSFEIKNLPPPEMSSKSLVAALNSDHERRRLTALWYTIDHPDPACVDKHELQSYYHSILDHVCRPGDRLSHEVLRHASTRAAIAAGQPILPHVLSRIAVESDWRAVGALAVVLATTAPRPREVKVCEALTRAAEHVDIRTRKQVALAISGASDQWEQGLLQALRRDPAVAGFLEQVHAGTASVSDLLEGLGPPDHFTAGYLCPKASQKIQEFDRALGDVQGQSVSGLPTWPGGTHPYFEYVRFRRLQDRAQAAGDDRAESYGHQAQYIHAAHDLDSLESSEAQLLKAIERLASVSLPVKRLLAAKVAMADDSVRAMTLLEVSRTVELVQAGWETISDVAILDVWAKLADFEEPIQLINAIGASAALAEAPPGIGPREWFSYLVPVAGRTPEMMYCLANSFVQTIPGAQGREALVGIFKKFGFKSQAKVLKWRFAALDLVDQSVSRPDATGSQPSVPDLRAGGSMGVVPTPHPSADPNRAVALNIAYQHELALWKTLPWWKRKTTRRPEPPTGI